MFSATEYQYIKDLTIQMYNNGYRNYACVTNNPTNYTNNNTYDITCYYSNTDINVSSYTFTFYSDTRKCNFDSNSYSDNNTIDKLVCSDYTGGVEFSSKEFIYSNVGEFSNIIGDYETSLNNHLSLDYAYLIPILLVLPIVVGFVHHFFRID